MGKYQITSKEWLEESTDSWTSVTTLNEKDMVTRFLKGKSSGDAWFSIVPNVISIKYN